MPSSATCISSPVSSCAVQCGLGAWFVSSFGLNGPISSRISAPPVVTRSPAIHPRRRIIVRCLSGMSTSIRVLFLLSSSRTFHASCLARLCSTACRPFQCLRDDLTSYPLTSTLSPCSQGAALASGAGLSSSILSVVPVVVVGHTGPSSDLDVLPWVECMVRCQRLRCRRAAPSILHGSPAGRCVGGGGPLVRRARLGFLPLASNLPPIGWYVDRSVGLSVYSSSLLISRAGCAFVGDNGGDDDDGAGGGYD